MVLSESIQQAQGGNTLNGRWLTSYFSLEMRSAGFFTFIEMKSLAPEILNTMRTCRTVKMLLVLA
jgi:hypothetical protein